MTFCQIHPNGLILYFYRKRWFVS